MITYYRGYISCDSLLSISELRYGTTYMVEERAYHPFIYLISEAYLILMLRYHLIVSKT